MAQCPRCKEDMPLLSKVCPVCGYVMADDGKTPTADEFVTTLNLFLHDIKIIPQPSFMKSMGQLSFITLPLVAVYLLIMALVSEAGVFWILFGIFVILSLWVIVKKAKGKLGNEPFNRVFNKLKVDYEFHEQMAKMHFGQHREVAGVLTDISAQIAAIEEKRNAGNRKNLLVWMVLILVFCGVASTGVFSVNHALNGKNDEVQSVTVAGKGNPNAGNWKNAVQAFKESPESKDDYECNKLAVKILPLILNAGESRAAEEFFTGNCMGKVGDYDCAVLIVNHYLGKASETEAAKEFVRKCDKMRYASDQRKLEKLLTKK